MRSEMRVLQIIPSTNIGGAETMLLSLLQGMDGSTYRFHVICLGDSPFLAAAGRLCETTTLRVFKGKKDIGFLLQLVRLLRRVKPDVLHSHHFLLHSYAALAGWLTATPVVATLHTLDEIETLGERISLWVTRALCRYLVAVTPEQAGHFGFPHGQQKVRCIPNGTPLASISPDRVSELRRRVRGAMGFKQNETVAVCVGNFRPVKGHSYLLEAARLLAVELPGFRLLLVGDGDLRTALEEQARNLGIATFVRFLGFRTDIAELLAASDLFVLPSLSEANSIALMEAMALACPVVATDVGGNRQLVRDAVTGFLVPPRSPEALAGAIRRLARDPDAAVLMGCRGKERVRERFGIDAMVLSYQGLYGSIGSRDDARGGKT